MKSVMSRGKEWWLRRRADPRLKNNNKTTRGFPVDSNEKRKASVQDGLRLNIKFSCVK